MVQGQRRNLLSDDQLRLIDDGMAAEGMTDDADLARALDVDPSTVSKWRSRDSGISIPRLRQIAAVLKIPYGTLADPAGRNGQGSDKDRVSVTGAIDEGSTGGAELASRELHRRVSHYTYVLFRLRGRANAGAGGGVLGDQGEDVALERETLRGIAHPERLLLVEIGGDCMSYDPDGDHLQNGDYALFDPTAPVNDGDIVLVSRPLGDDGEELIVKRLRWLEKGRRAELTPNVPIPGMSGRQVVEIADGDEPGAKVEGVLSRVIHVAGRSRNR